MLSWTARLELAKAELAQSESDPLRAKLEATVRGIDAISTTALLDLIGLPKTTGNGRRDRSQHARAGICANQVTAVHARRLPRHRNPGLGSSCSEAELKQGDKVENSHLNTAMHSG